MTKWLVAGDDLGLLTKPFEDRLSRTDDPRRRRILETVIRHLRTEGSSDLEGVMKTVSPSADFRHPDGRRSRGLDQVRTHYTNMFAQGGIANLSVSDQRVILDDDVIVNEVNLRLIVPWKKAKAAGYAISEESGHYAIWRRMNTVMPFDEDGLLAGEITYTALLDPTQCEQIPDAELSAGYWTWLKGVPGAA